MCHFQTELLLVATESDPQRAHPPSDHSLWKDSEPNLMNDAGLLVGLLDGERVGQ